MTSGESADLELCVSLRVNRVPEDEPVVDEHGHLRNGTVYRSEPELTFDLVGRVRSKRDLDAAVALLRQLADHFEREQLNGMTAAELAAT